MKKGIDNIGIGIVFFCHDGKGNVVLDKRSDNCRDERGRWEPGGGAVKLGESIENTISRELKEEYCAKPINTEFLGFRDVHRVDDDGNKTHWIMLDFKVLVDRKKVKNGVPNKHSEIKWFKLNKLPKPLHSQFPFFLKKYERKLL